MNMVEFSRKRPGNFKDITGQTFSRLKVVEYVGQRRWRCACDCGNTTLSFGRDLRSGKTKSCGCLHKYKVSELMATHRLSRTPEHRIWCGMRMRCFNHNRKEYKNYGGRGITICDRWSSFELFLKDMGKRPSNAHSIERIDNDGDYEPSNCRWATAIEQAKNRRPANGVFSGKNNTGKGQGVWRQRGKWRAVINHNNKRIHLGMFEQFEEALSARKAAEQIYLGK